MPISFTGGSGSIHGIDISQKCFNVASKRLRQEIDTGKMKLHLGSVTKIPYADCTFDRIFHCNCYYYWPDMDEAVKELYRVIKPGSIMATVSPHERLIFADKNGFMQCGNIDPYRYTMSLERHGFKNIDMKVVQYERQNLTTIMATS